MKMLHDNVLDAALDYILTNVSHIHLLSAEPDIDTWANIAAYTLGNAAMVGGSFTGPGDYAGGGRQIVTPEVSASITGTGTVTYVAIVDTGGTEILAFSETAATAVSSGGSLTVPPWLIFLEDPA